ncbi:hypothetical protein BDV36DRAFT_266333 [Aspergillus pseudocaelatus]|uniref:Uncharacterized protein n=1 Tax=Aspergillus pseudocaelatus TaxID=1825620 RepID=A0ABQ6WC00_9EURO|nr:hypothetical protein BDV36DRAFT_266333 [Aspergillus pseudocaelatus]
MQCIQQAPVCNKSNNPKNRRISARLQIHWLSMLGFGAASARVVVSAAIEGSDPH